MRSLSFRGSWLVPTLLTVLLSTRGEAQIDPARELMITNLGVVEDPIRTAPGGAWHFGTMMANIAGNVPAPRFVEAWLQTLMLPQTVNGQTVFDQSKAAAIAEFRNRWPKDATGKVDPARAPFRLLAIVNRPDLVKVGPEGPVSYGECRFVYGAFDPLDPEGKETFFVIFEFDIPVDFCADVVAWANAWHDLGSLPFGAAYNDALQAITDAVVLPVTGSTRPNQSNLNQLRTNDFELLGMSQEWNLREWNLISLGSQNAATLTAVTTKQTPHFSFVSSASGRQALAEYLTQESQAILDGDHVIPEVFQSSSGPVNFLGGDARNTCTHPKPGPNCTLANGSCFAEGTKWWAPGFVPQCNGTLAEGQVRHLFALQTCSGCHHQETGVSFVHVDNRLPGTESQLSRFLTGTGYPIGDIFFGNQLPHSFADLAHRATVLTSMLGLECDPGPQGVSPTLVLAGIQAEMGTRVH